LRDSGKPKEPLGMRIKQHTSRTRSRSANHYSTMLSPTTLHAKKER